VGDHPANLLFRWFLDLAVLASVGLWGWQRTGGWGRPFVAVLLPLTIVAVLGLFAAEDDPTRSGYAPVPVPGGLRFLLEVAVFGLACLALADLGLHRAGMSLSGGVLVHYALDWRRVRRLLGRRSGSG
jgi:hypothetical protein